jgi:hypothetical protein
LTDIIIGLIIGWVITLISLACFIMMVYYLSEIDDKLRSIDLSNYYVANIMRLPQTRVKDEDIRKPELDRSMRES